MLDTALKLLEREHLEKGKSELFEALRPFITATPTGVSQGDIAESLGMKPGAVKTAVHRLRRRYKDVLRERIGCTVSDESAIEEELSELFEALA